MPCDDRKRVSIWRMPPPNLAIWSWNFYIYNADGSKMSSVKVSMFSERRFRRIVLRHRDGWVVNVKRVDRLYRELSLQLRHKTPKRLVPES